MKITIRNCFHNTITTTKTEDMRITRERARRIWRTLCGMDCSCGGRLGERGSWDEWGIEDEGGNGMEFIDHEDGGGKFEYV